MFADGGARGAAAARRPSERVRSEVMRGFCGDKKAERARSISLICFGLCAVFSRAHILYIYTHIFWLYKKRFSLVGY